MQPQENTSHQLENEEGSVPVVQNCLPAAETRKGRERVKCKRCGNEWRPRIVSPKVCRFCCSPLWNSDKPPRQFQYRGSRWKRTPDQVEQDFWSRATVGGKDDCWEWIGSCNPKGYGRFRLNGFEDYAHRQAWRIKNGEIEDGKHVLHRCDNPKCVNPSHLFLGSNLDNIKDCISKGRNSKGERHQWSKLSEKQVLEIRARWVPRKIGLRDQLAKEFGVCVEAIYSIVTRRTWTHI